VRAAAHFGVTGADLKNANFIIVQPPAYSDPNALNSGYCAFHDYTSPDVPGNTYYQGLKAPDGQPAPLVSYTNMPYANAINVPWIVTSDGQILAGNENVCGENAVNNDARGKLDGFSIVLGHEIEETITDPGAEGTVGSGSSVTYYGGWYGATDPNENGDKCAWVGEPLNNAAGVQSPSGAPNLLPISGALGNITGNAGDRFAVQSLWSNADNAGTGYCAGAGTDSPVPAQAYGNTPDSSGGGGGAAPASTSRPTISGPPTAGQTLTESHGAWTNNPASYAYQWKRCDPSGANCETIWGATAQTYTVTGNDVGRTIVVEEAATNSSGTGGPVASAPTAVVTAASSSGGGGSKSGGGSSGSHGKRHPPTKKPVHSKHKPAKHKPAKHKPAKHTKHKNKHKHHAKPRPKHKKRSQRR
jgi:hypothetical protein